MQTYSRYSKHFIRQFVTHLWDLIETSFCENVKGIKDINNNDNDADYVDKVIVKDRNNYDDNDN